jgi:hypothetical protein
MRNGFVVLLGILVIQVQSGCTSSDSFSPRFGIAKITLPSGHDVYVKRQVRGLSYDELAISANSNPCLPADPETDYIFSGQGPFPVFYLVSADTLVIYDSMPLKEPRSGIPHLKIVTKTLNPHEYNDMNVSWATKGIYEIRGQCRWKGVPLAKGAVPIGNALGLLDRQRQQFCLKTPQEEPHPRSAWASLFARTGINLESLFSASSAWDRIRFLATISRAGVGASLRCMRSATPLRLPVITG